jgi:hypothetical protein
MELCLTLVQLMKRMRVRRTDMGLHERSLELRRDRASRRARRHLQFAAIVFVSGSHANRRNFDMSSEYEATIFDGKIGGQHWQAGLHVSKCPDARTILHPYSRYAGEKHKVSSGPGPLFLF